MGSSFDFFRLFSSVEPKPKKKIFTIFKIGGFGSLITSFPLVVALKKEFPDAEIFFITSKQNKIFVEYSNISENVITIDIGNVISFLFSLLKFIIIMRKIRSLYFIDLQIYGFRRLSSFCALLSGAGTRIGFYRSGDTMRQGIFDWLIYANIFVPVHELYLQMARLIGCVPEATGANDFLRVDQAGQAEASDLTRGWCRADDRLLVVNPNTSGKAIERRWPIGHFAGAVARILDRRADVRVALIGSAAEYDYVEQLRRELWQYGDRVRNFAGRTSLGGLFALLRRADCLLTNDSGPLHFGAALGTPTVGLFGPVHPDHYGRMGDPAKTVIFYRPMVCSPCVHLTKAPPCGGKNDCMRLIQPDQVGAACLDLLRRSTDPSRRPPAGAWQFPQAPRTVSPEGAAFGAWARRRGLVLTRAALDGAGRAERGVQPSVICTEGPNGG